MMAAALVQQHSRAAVVLSSVGAGGRDCVCLCAASQGGSSAGQMFKTCVQRTAGCVVLRCRCIGLGNLAAQGKCVGLQDCMGAHAGGVSAVTHN